MKWITNILADQLAGMDEDKVNDWFDDLETHGCASGMVGALVYYTDTRAVYEANEDEILDALDDVGYVDLPAADGRGLIDLDSMVNNRVWAAFEAGAREAWEAIGGSDLCTCKGGVHVPVDAANSCSA